jgi:hypothetical protein
MSAFGAKADMSGHGVMSAHSLPEPIIGYARSDAAVAFVSNIRQ